jgi:hypothetical protein
MVRRRLGSVAEASAAVQDGAHELPVPGQRGPAFSPDCGALAGGREDPAAALG